jgi:catechol 2,3-dioxygenase
MQEDQMTRDEIGLAPRGFRLPDATHIGHVRLQVASLDRSVAYYEKVLGLRVVERSASTASMAPMHGDNVILQLTELPGARAVPRRGLLGLYHFAVLMPDRASLGRFVTHLSEIGEYAGMSDHLVSEALYLTDPDGLGIEVYADRPRDTWVAMDKQIAMTTKPLNVDDLVAAANGKQWTGAPEGTTIGHVHFYVGDIDGASSFYHDGLGLDKIVWTYPGALFMSAGGYHHHVGANIWAQGAPPATAQDAKLVEWQLVLPDTDSVEKAAQSMESGGYAVTRENGSAVADDPWGIRVRIQKT